MAAPISEAQAGSGWRCDLPDQRPLPERPVDDDRDAAVPRQRKNAILDLAVQHVVGDLDEVDRLARHDLLDLLVAPPLRGRDAHVAQPALRLHGEQGREMLLPRQEVVHLEQVEPPDAPAGPGLLDLLRAPRPGEIQTLSAEKRPEGLPSLARP